MFTIYLEMTASVFIQTFKKKKLCVMTLNVQEELCFRIFLRVTQAKMSDYHSAKSHYDYIIHTFRQLRNSQTEAPTPLSGVKKFHD